jgi:hypothetical protein
MHRPPSRLVGFLVLLLVAGTLALAACNSNSVSGSRPSLSTNTESKSRTATSRPHSQGLVDAAIAKSR